MTIYFLFIYFLIVYQLDALYFFLVALLSGKFQRFEETIFERVGMKFDSILWETSYTLGQYKVGTRDTERQTSVNCPEKC